MTRGRDLARAHDLAGAEVAFRAALMIFPDDESALVELGMVLEQMNRFDDALTTLKRAAAVAEPGRPRAAVLAKIGMFHDRRGDTEAAIRAFRELVCRATERRGSQASGGSYSMATWTLTFVRASDVGAISLGGRVLCERASSVGRSTQDFGAGRCSAGLELRL